MEDQPERVRPVLAAHVLLRRGAEVLLLRRYGTGFGDGLYSVIAGHVESFESASDAAVREAGEEARISIAVGPESFAGVMHRNAQDPRIDIFYRVSEWDGSPSIGEPDKCDAMEWCPVDELPENMVEYVKEALLADGRADRPWYIESGWS